jgi:glutathione S-transferase
MTLKIYSVGASRASRPLWAAEELGVAYEHIKVPYQNNGAKTPEMLALNANGHIPVVEDDGVVVWESMACSLWIAKKYEGDISPQNLGEEADALRWSFWAVTECEKDALTVLMHRVAMPEARRLPELALQAESRLHVPMRVLDDHLKRHRFLAGDHFTIADVNVAAVLAWALAGRFPFESYAQAQRWLTECLARPAQQRVRAIAKA